MKHANLNKRASFVSTVTEHLSYLRVFVLILSLLVILA